MIVRRTRSTTTGSKGARDPQGIRHGEDDHFGDFQGAGHMSGPMETPDVETGHRNVGRSARGEHQTQVPVTAAREKNVTFRREIG